MKKRISWLIYLIISIILVLLQTSFLPEFTTFKVRPDLVLLFVVSIGLVLNYKQGLLAGAIAGLVAGIISWNLWGLYLLTYCLAGFLAGNLPEKMEADNFFIPLSASVGASIIELVLFFVVGSFLNIYQIMGDFFVKALAFLIWNAIFAIPVFLVVKFIIIGEKNTLDIQSSLSDSIIIR
ncbi:MAG: rod shape-determining protein MreD [Vulcanimicrobiota bacterium]